MRNVLNRADQLVAVSKSTAAAICGQFPELAQKITVAYPGTDHLCSISKGAAPIANGKPKAPYILAVNTFEIRKNIPFIIRLFEHLKRELRLPHQLMLVGQPANDYRRVMNAWRNRHSKMRLLVTNWISNEKLVECYRHCDFFINASAYEGFGFTPFEAISSGCPVFLFKNNTVAEIFGDHPYVIDNYDVESWKTIIDLAIRSGFAEKISARQISHLTWQRAAETVMPLIHQTISTRENSFVS
ncbi:MAG: glycosyltransferase [Calditrichia bacterium]